MKNIKVSYMSLIPTAIWSCILCFIPAIIQAIRIFFSKYSYNDDNVIIKTGAIKQEQNSIPFYRLSDIQVNQSIIGQYLKYGTITLFDKDKIVVMKYVDNAEAVAEDLRKAMMKAKKDTGIKSVNLE